MSAPTPTEARTCARCGRVMEYRRRWAAVWDEVRYCSARCRGRRNSRLDRSLEDELVRLLERRVPSATLCPSEVARAVRPDDWAPIMEDARCAARRLAARGVVEWRQRGRRVDPSTARGPVRIARGPSWAGGRGAER